MEDILEKCNYNSLVVGSSGHLEILGSSDQEFFKKTVKATSHRSKGFKSTNAKEVYGTIYIMMNVLFLKIYSSRK